MYIETVDSHEGPNISPIKLAYNNFSLKNYELILPIAQVVKRKNHKNDETSMKCFYFHFSSGVCGGPFEIVQLQYVNLVNYMN